MGRPSGFSPATVELIWARDYGRCAWCGFTITGERGYQWSVHHRRPRGSGGTSLGWVNQPANGVLLHGHGTVGCHAEVESDRTRASRLGFLVSVNGRARSVDVPIRHQVHGPCMLLNDGSFRPVGEALYLELTATWGRIQGDNS